MIDSNLCEHCAREAPTDARFCSDACEECEHTDAGNIGCAGICLPEQMSITDYSARMDEVERAASPEELQRLIPHADDGMPWPTLGEHIANLREMAKCYPWMVIRPVRLGSLVAQ